MLTPEEPQPKILQAKMFRVVITAIFGFLIFDKTLVGDEEEVESHSTPRLKTKEKESAG